MSTRPTEELRDGALDGSEEPTVLGASRTLPGGRSSRRDGEGKRKGKGTSDATDPTAPPTPSASSRAGHPLRALALVVVAVVLFAMVPIVTSAFKRTPNDSVGVSYSSGIIGDATFQRVVPPGTGLFYNGFFGRLYLYPSGDLAVTIPDPAPDAVLLAQPIVAPTEDRVPVTIEVNSHFRLNTEHLDQFHESFGVSYKAYEEEGWLRFKREVVRSTLAAAITDAVALHPAVDLLGGPEALARVEADASAAFAERIEEVLGGPLLCGPDVSGDGECPPPVVLLASVSIPEYIQVPGGGDDGSSEPAGG